MVISAASGAVGSVAGQLARRHGARVVGVAGGAEKCLWVQDSLGFDDCVDHRALDLRAELAAACPNGIDAYFENVGGAVQEAVFDLLNPFARVAMCGMVSQYNEAEFPPGPNLGFVVGKRVTIQGFIVSDKPEKLAEWRSLAMPWVADGSLIYREDVHEGLENAPEALAGMLGGRNFGKLLVRVGRGSHLTNDPRAGISEFTRRSERDHLLSSPRNACPRESGGRDPGPNWVPAFAGMTTEGVALPSTDAVVSSQRSNRHAGGGICAVGVDLEICTSSSVMSAGMSANSGVLR